MIREVQHRHVHRVEVKRKKKEKDEQAAGNNGPIGRGKAQSEKCRGFLKRSKGKEDRRSLVKKTKLCTGTGKRRRSKIHRKCKASAAAFFQPAKEEETIRE